MIVRSIGFNFPRHITAADNTFTPFLISGPTDRTPLCTSWNLAFETVELVPFQCHFFLRVLLTNECFEITSKYQDRLLLAWDRDQTLVNPSEDGLLIYIEHGRDFFNRIAQMSANNLRVEASHF